MKFLELILQQKRIEIQNIKDEIPEKVLGPRSFAKHLKENRNKLHIIGEVKPPLLNAAIPSIMEQAKIYEEAGVSAIAVLTDEVFFKGNIDDLRQVAAAVKIPVLNKDFILDKKQINRAVNSGATMITLLAAVLNEDELQTLGDYAKELNLEVVVEVHDLPQLRIAQKLNVELISVNNRNFKSFEPDLQNSINLAKEFLQDSDVLYISESGIKTTSDLQMLAKNFNAVLIGETLLAANNIEEKIAEFLIER